MFDLLENLEKVVLSNNPLKYIDQKWFENNTLLRELVLSSCGFGQLSSDSLTSLKALKNLQIVDLSDNGFGILESGTFTSFQSLVSLSLNNNGIIRLNSYAFGKLPTLSYLNIKDNKIDEIEPNFFDNFPEIREVDSKNNICINLSLTQISGVDSTMLTSFQECFKNWITPRVPTTTPSGASKLSTATVVLSATIFAVISKIL